MAECYILYNFIVKIGCIILSYGAYTYLTVYISKMAFHFYNVRVCCQICFFKIFADMKNNHRKNFFVFVVIGFTHSYIGLFTQ